MEAKEEGSREGEERYVLPLPLSAVTLTAPVIGRGPFSLSLSLSPVALLLSGSLGARK